MVPSQKVGHSAAPAGSSSGCDSSPRAAQPRPEEACTLPVRCHAHTWSPKQRHRGGGGNSTPSWESLLLLLQATQQVQLQETVPGIPRQRQIKPQNDGCEAGNQLGGFFNEVHDAAGREGSGRRRWSRHARRRTEAPSMWANATDLTWMQV